MNPGGCVYGFAAGGVLGVIAAEAGGSAWRARILARHRNNVNELVRRLNHLIASAP